MTMCIAGQLTYESDDEKLIEIFNAKETILKNIVHFCLCKYIISLDPFWTHLIYKVI